MGTMNTKVPLSNGFGLLGSIMTLALLGSMGMAMSLYTGQLVKSSAQRNLASQIDSRSADLERLFSSKATCSLIMNNTIIAVNSASAQELRPASNLLTTLIKSGDRLLLTQNSLGSTSPVSDTVILNGQLKILLNGQSRPNEVGLEIEVDNQNRQVLSCGAPNSGSAPNAQQCQQGTQARGLNPNGTLICEAITQPQSARDSSCPPNQYAQSISSSGELSCVDLPSFVPPVVAEPPVQPPPLACTPQTETRWVIAIENEIRQGQNRRWVLDRSQSLFSYQFASASHACRRAYQGNSNEKIYWLNKAVVEQDNNPDLTVLFGNTALEEPCFRNTCVVPIPSNYQSNNATELCPNLVGYEDLNDPSWTVVAEVDYRNLSSISGEKMWGGNQQTVTRPRDVFDSNDNGARVRILKKEFPANNCADTQGVSP
jgi:hypothetical protein